MPLFGGKRKSTGLSQPVTRLVFSYENGEINLSRRQNVKMRLPPSAPLTSSESRSGFWFTLLDSRGKEVYRRVLGAPPEGMEVFQNTRDESILHLPDVKTKSHFTVLIPELSSDATLVVYGPPAGGSKTVGKPAQEIARFSLGTKGEHDGRR